MRITNGFHFTHFEQYRSCRCGHHENPGRFACEASNYRYEIARRRFYAWTFRKKLLEKKNL